MAVRPNHVTNQGLNKDRGRVRWAEFRLKQLTHQGKSNKEAWDIIHAELKKKES